MFVPDGTVENHLILLNNNINNVIIVIKTILIWKIDLAMGPPDKKRSELSTCTCSTLAVQRPPIIATKASKLEKRCHSQLDIFRVSERFGHSALNWSAILILYEQGGVSSTWPADKTADIAGDS